MCKLGVCDVAVEHGERLSFWFLVVVVTLFSSWALVVDQPIGTTNFSERFVSLVAGGTVVASSC